MLPVLLFLMGAALSVFCLWQLRRWLEQADGVAAAGSRRLGDLVDELVATAETTVSVVAEKAEALGAVIARADERQARLEAAVHAAPAGSAVVPAPVAAMVAAMAPAVAPAVVPAPVAAMVAAMAPAVVPAVVPAPVAAMVEAMAPAVVPAVVPAPVAAMVEAMAPALMPAPVAAGPAVALPPAPATLPAPVGRSGLPAAQRELYTKVYALADAGHDMTGIARTLNIAKGEVQLILGLRPVSRGGE